MYSKKISILNTIPNLIRLNIFVIILAYYFEWYTEFIFGSMLYISLNEKYETLNIFIEVKKIKNVL